MNDKSRLNPNSKNKFLALINATRDIPTMVLIKDLISSFDDHDGHLMQIANAHIDALITNINMTIKRDEHPAEKDTNACLGFD